MCEIDNETATQPKEDNTKIDNYFIHSKGVHYQGNWMGGLPHGPGTAIYPDGAYYVGNFDEGEAHDSNGYLIFPNGSQYQGNVVKSKLEGKGKLTHKLGYSYAGEWADNKPHG